MQTERYCVEFRALAALRDPAPPACSPRWGFGGGGDGRRTNEGDPMTKVKSKRKPASRVNDSKSKTHNGVSRTPARKAVQSPPTPRHESKKAHIIAMLRAPSGATIAAMARAAKWQPHSVRGFL